MFVDIWMNHCFTNVYLLKFCSIINIIIHEYSLQTTLQQLYLYFFFFLKSRLGSIADQWEYLTQKTTEKSLKLKEANKQRTYIAAVKDLDFWLGEVESLLTSEDSGKDLASVQNLIKKHQLVEADIQAHEDRIRGYYILLLLNNMHT